MGLFLYTFGKALFTVIFRGIFCTSIAGRENIPRHGPVLLVANHISFADPPLVGVATPRRVEFMAMVELFRHPVLARLVTAVGTIPVDRAKVDHRAAREAIRRLREGRCIGIFPEGGIRLGSRSVLAGDPDLRPGAEIIAVLSQAAIVPVILRNSRLPYTWRNWFRRPNIRVTFGASFCLWHPPASRDAVALQAVLRDELLKTVALVEAPR